jgi:type IV pilus assembly protein PilM
MNLLPKASGTRPRVACEITAQGVVAGQSAVAGSPLTEISRAELAAGAVAPSLKPGNLVDRIAVTAAIGRALEGLGLRPNSRNADITLIVPDAAVRVLLLDFDALSNKMSEALPIVRFRLKKLLPFDADDAMVSFQIMSSNKGGVRVLAVAIPRDVLNEYESAVREAGYEPGCVIPSTVAALAAVEDESASLLVNANSLGVTTAIVRNGILLLHRSVDMQEHTEGVPANVPPAMMEASIAEPAPSEPAQDWQHVPLGEEIAQAVNVAAAYFEDTLSAVPQQILSAGPLGAEQLSRILASSGIERESGLRVRELVESKDLLASAVTSSVPRAWLSGVMGALRG